MAVRRSKKSRNQSRKQSAGQRRRGGAKRLSRSQRSRSKRGSDRGSAARRTTRGASKRRAASGGGGIRSRAKRGPKDRKAASKSAAKERARLAKERDQQKREKEKERTRLAKERDQQKREKEKERARLAKERDQQKREKEKERTRLAKERERDKREKDKARERSAKEREREKEKERARLAKERDQQKREKEKERERLKKQQLAERAAKEKAREEDRVRLAAERETEKARLKAEREAERARVKAEREAERIRLKAERESERERLKEEARRRKEEERAKRDAERDAYRKAKEAEQARIRAEREAARRALEGRIARAGRASRAGARSGSTTRVYTPASIPDQSGTRRAEGALPSDPSNKFANLRVPPPPEGQERATGPIPRTIPPPPPPPPAATIEERYRKILERLGNTDDAFQHDYHENFLMSWIYHDSALEGVVYTYEELRTAINPNITVVPDSSLQSVCEEIRKHKAAIELVKDLADKKRVPINVDTAKRIYLVLHPEEGDLKTVKYRKDIPQHRLYFHEYAAPDKIAYKVRQVFDWFNGPEPKKTKNAIRIAARVHYDFLRIFPFANDSGKVARLLMNLLLLRSDCPPAIIHSTERQRYYESLRGSLPTLITMVTESINNALASIEKKLDERDSRMRTFAS